MVTFLAVNVVLGAVASLILGPVLKRSRQAHERRSS